MNIRLASIFLCAAAAALAATLHAQTALDSNMGATITVDATTNPAVLRFSWWGISRRHYLVQRSTDLQSWTSMPGLNPSGADATIIYAEIADDNVPTVFFRVFEFNPSETSTSASDADGNGLPDVWEQYYFGTTGATPTSTPDGDGVPILVKFRLGLKAGTPAASAPVAATELKVHLPN